MVLALNYFMIEHNETMSRVVFYLLAAGVPVGILSAARAIARVHRGEPQDDLREGTVPVLWGVVIAAIIYVISFIHRSI